MNQKLEECSFCDLFAGTVVVGNYFHNKVKSIIYNDREHYSFVINSAFYSRVEEEKYEAMLEDLNHLEGLEGFIFNEYSEFGSAGRLYFNGNNGKKKMPSGFILNDYFKVLKLIKISISFY